MSKKTVLITGGTGFLGKRLALKLKNDYKVILAGRNNKQNLIASNYTGCKAVPMDIVNIESVRDVFAEFKPNIVIHAAATKFVDLAEQFPMECVDINVTGSQNIARISLQYNCESVIGISTDKAAPPVRNTYGLTKALMERMFCAMNGKAFTKFVCVRYGNVVWSTGSVFTIWKNMLENNGVIGTTGPEMRRFFFTVNDAIDLVITALLNIDRFQGCVLSRTMKAARIEDILKVWTENTNKHYEKVEGRPGERKDEFLIGELELPYTEELLIDNIKHFLISFNKKAETPLEVGLSSANAEKLSVEEIREIIFNPPLEEI